jgi:hypothetical protein
MSDTIPYSLDLVDIGTGRPVWLLTATDQHGQEEALALLDEADAKFWRYVFTLTAAQA